MLARCCYLMLGLLLTVSTGAAQTAVKLDAKDQAAIRALLEQYRKALGAADGEAFVKILDSKTVQWHQETAQAAQSANKAELAKLGLLSRLMVLRLRHEHKKADLAKLTGPEVIVMAVKQGWINNNFADMVVIAAYGVNKDGLAYVTLRQNAKVPAFWFTKESGPWRLALSHTFAGADKGLEQVVKKAGLSEEDFLLKTLETESKKKVDKKILDGPLP